MTHAVIAVNASCAPKATKLRQARTAIATAILCCAFLMPTAVAQNVQHTKNSADLKLRGNLTVNPSTRAVELSIPFGAYPGRAGHGLPVTISYSSKVWRIAYQGYVPGTIASTGPINEDFTIAIAKYAEHSAAGWTSSLGFPVIEIPGQEETYNQFGDPAYNPGSPSSNCTENGCYNVDRIRVRMPDGSTHELRSSDQPYRATDPPQLPDDMYAVDGSRMLFRKSTWTLFLPDGSRYELLSPQRYIDRHGNVLTYRPENNYSWTDTLGRELAHPFAAPVDAQGNQVYTVTVVGGAPVSYTLRWKKLGDPGVLTVPQGLHYIANQGCPRAVEQGGTPFLFWSGANKTHICNAGATGSFFNPTVLHQVVLPTGQSYTFTYNVYGEIDKVVLPTGGYERYEYEQFMGLSSTSYPYAYANRGVVARYVSATGAQADEQTWIYSGSSGFVSIIAPDKSLTETYMHTDSPMSGTFGFSPNSPLAGRVYDKRISSAPDPVTKQRRMLRRKLTKWDVTGSNAGGIFTTVKNNATRNARKAKEVEILLDTAGDALAKTTVYNYPNTAYEFTSGVNLGSVEVYDYVPVAQSTARTGDINSMPAPGRLLRVSEYQYLDDNEAYRNRNLLGLVTLEVIKDGARNPVAKTETLYDQNADYPLLDCGAAVGREDPGQVVRGNATTAGRWLNTTSAWVRSHTQYDRCGNARKTWDPNGNVSELQYTDSFSDLNTARNTFAYPTRAISPVPDADGSNGSAVAPEVRSVYDFSTGALVETTDANGQLTRYFFRDEVNAPDPLGRLKRVEYADGGWTTYDYSNTPGNLFIRTRTALDSPVVNSSYSIESYQYFDGLARPSRSYSARPPLSYSYDGSPAQLQWVATKTTYDNMGRVDTVSNPVFTTTLDDFTPAANTVTTTVYDELGRVQKVTTPDSSFATSIYVGNEVTVIDQAGKRRSSESDGLGRLVKVIEAPGDASYGFETTYEYDALGNLEKVIQGQPGQMQQTRLFDYDSLSRLTSATNPESGRVTYEYDAVGNLKKKVDARHVRTDYAYDGMNRIVERSHSVEEGHQSPAGYAATSPVAYFYDGTGMPLENGIRLPVPNYSMGKLTAVKSAVSETIYTEFDLMGRVKKHRQVVDPGATSPQQYLMEYKYDLAGNVTEEKYPSGRVVQTSYDNAGQIDSVNARKIDQSGCAPGKKLCAPILIVPTFLFQYTAHGARAQVRFNGLTEKTVYNERLQPTRIELRRESAGESLLSLDYTYGTIVNGVLDVTRNNGNVQSQRIRVPGLDVTQSYEYDALNRLKQVQEAGGQSPWKQVYSYDQFGNRTFDAGTTFPALPSNLQDAVYNPQMDSATNRLKEDQNGDGQKDYEYDAAGNVVRNASGQTFDYDGDNMQVTFNGGPNANTGGASYFYDALGKRVKKVTAYGTTIFVYNAGGALVAEYSTEAPEQGAGGMKFLTADSLGSPRVITDGNGKVVSRHDYAPFGEEVFAGRTSEYKQDGVRQQFTGQERDKESGLDYFDARYYSSQQGRFTSIDPLAASGQPANPQTWNRYAYVLNSPLKFIDPTGMFAIPKQNYIGQDQKGEDPCPDCQPERIDSSICASCGDKANVNYDPAVGGNTVIPGGRPQGTYVHAGIDWVVSRKSPYHTINQLEAGKLKEWEEDYSNSSSWQVGIGPISFGQIKQKKRHFFQFGVGFSWPLGSAQFAGSQEGNGRTESGVSVQGTTSWCPFICPAGVNTSLPIADESQGFRFSSPSKAMRALSDFNNSPQGFIGTPQHGVGLNIVVPSNHPKGPKYKIRASQYGRSIFN